MLLPCPLCRPWHYALLWVSMPVVSMTGGMSGARRSQPTQRGPAAHSPSSAQPLASRCKDPLLRNLERTGPDCSGTQRRGRLRSRCVQKSIGDAIGSRAVAGVSSASARSKPAQRCARPRCKQRDGFERKGSAREQLPALRGEKGGGGYVGAPPPPQSPALTSTEAPCAATSWAAHLCSGAAREGLGRGCGEAQAVCRRQSPCLRFAGSTRRETQPAAETGEGGQTLAGEGGAWAPS